MYFFVKSVIFLFIFILFGCNNFLTDATNHATSTNITNLKVNNYTNFTFTFWNGSKSMRELKVSDVVVDCFGLGATFTKVLTWFFQQKETPLFTTFYIRTRAKSHRDKVLIGDQFGLEWTNFDIRRKTVVITHGFLSSGDEDWVREMEEAFLLLGDVNVIITDWSEGSNTWNYFKAAINTRLVGSYIAKLFEHIANTTINSQGPPENEWGDIHFVGHSLGAHISSFAANLIRKSPSKWKIDRITGLDPAQPCFREVDPILYLDRSDAPFVDVIHTNGRLLSSLGFGIPQPIGHVDFYPNGGKVQPGCVFTKTKSVPLPQSVINQAICSHGRSHSYFTESIILSAKEINNCTFWGHHWDLTFRRALNIIDEYCNTDKCSEMGINSVYYSQRGTFFTLTAASTPHCHVDSSDKLETLKLMYEELKHEIND